MTMAKAHAPGCPCCLASGETCFLVYGCCYLPVANATVTVKRGGFVIASGTTDATGKWCTNLALKGDVWDITPPPGTDFAAAADLALRIERVNTWALTPAPGFACCCNNNPIPDTLILNDGFGDVILSSNGSDYYHGFATRPASGTAVTQDEFCTPLGTYSASVELEFILHCSARGRCLPIFSVRAACCQTFWGGLLLCPTILGCPGGGIFIEAGLSSWDMPSSCNPFLAEYNFTLGPPLLENDKCSLYYVYGSSASFLITE